MGGLHGVGVLVTRPEAQAAELTRLLASAHADVYHLPTLAVRARPGLAALRAALGPLDRYRWIIFMSANAVRHGAALLDGQSGFSLAAVGPATAAALGALGHPIELMPEHGFTTEQLLAMPALGSVRSSRILVVRGAHGRDLLGDTLAERGAEVSFAEVYERVCAIPPPGAVAAVEQVWDRSGIHVVTATSGEVLRCLIELLTPAGRQRARAATLLVGGERIGREARRMGFDGELILADSPQATALVAALTRWQARRASGH